MFGGVVGKRAKDYKLGSKSGLFKVNEQMVLNKNAEWNTLPGSTSDAPIETLAKADELESDGLIGEGFHYFKLSSTHTTEQLYYKPNMFDDGSERGMVRVFIGSTDVAPSEEKLDNNIQFEWFMVGKKSGSVTGVFANYGLVQVGSLQYYNTNTSGLVGTAFNYGTSGTHYNGTKLMFGGAGAHGIYNTNQNACSWHNSIGAIGAGWNGSTCGGYSGTLKMGLGQSGTPNYSVSGTFEFWLRK